MTEALSGKGPVRLIEPLLGGLAGQTFGFMLDERPLVLKRYPAGGPQVAVEFDNLRLAADVPVPTPDPVLIDEDGAWFGTPTIVMSRLPGRPEFNPSDVDGWVDQAASTLAVIHELDPGSVRSGVTPRWRRFSPNTAVLGQEASAARRAIKQLSAVAASVPVVFSPDDYNPGNLLYIRDELSGAVDWSEITVEPRQASQSHTGRTPSASTA